jgi:uncharacterized protein (TIGR02145 family)
MKKLNNLLILAAIAMNVIAHGQPSITFTFTGIYNSSYFQLDSIKVRNLSRDCDTVLYYPDTVLTIYYVGIEQNLDGPGMFNLKQNFPNPATERTSIKLFAPQRGLVNITIADAAGRRLLASDILLDKGYHSFFFTPPREGLYLFSACFGGMNRTIKILVAKTVGERSCFLEYSGNIPSDTPLKNAAIIQGFLFSPGDELMLIGHGDAQESGFMDCPDTSQDYVFQFATNIPCPGADSVNFEGQWYHTVQIFSQCWIIENMNAGIMVPSTQDQSDNDIIEKYCMGDVEYYCSLMGGLYFWDEMMKYANETGGQGICPDGFHLPRDLEWQILEGATDSTYGIGASEWNMNGWRGTDAGGNLKQAGFDFWEPPNTGATDMFGFSALAGGYFVQNSFWGPGYKGYFWSSDYPGQYYRNMDWNQAKIQRNTGGGGAALSVRCIRN